MNKIFATLLLLTSVGLYAQNDTQVGNIPTMGEKGLIAVWTDGSEIIHISMPTENGFSISRSQLYDFVSHLNQFDTFVTKASQTKIAYTDTLLSTACSVVAPQAGKIYLFASSNIDGSSYLGIRLVKASPGNNFGQNYTFWLQSRDGQTLKSLLVDAIESDRDIAAKLQTMREAAVGAR